MKQRATHGWHDADGFCYDEDCGDEAAQTILNCYINDWGPDTPIICNKNTFDRNRYAYGHWSYATGFMSEGPCDNFIYWANGQGLPDKKRIRNPYLFESENESDVSIE